MSHESIQANRKGQSPLIEANSELRSPSLGPSNDAAAHKGTSEEGESPRLSRIVPSKRLNPGEARRQFIGGSDARIIMGPDEEALVRLWREKRGESEPEDLSSNLIVQIGVVTEPLNRAWYEQNTGHIVRDVQRRVHHPVIRWMAATLDGIVDGANAVFEAKFMLPWSFSEEMAVEKHMAQLQHNMWVAQVKSAALSIITGGGKWLEITVPADALYQHLLVTAEKRFWRCVASGQRPYPFGIEPPRPPLPAIRMVDMSASNAWAEFAGLYRATRPAFLDHEKAKGELKALMPEDAKEAIGHGIRGKRSKAGAVSFDLLAVDGIEAVAPQTELRAARVSASASTGLGAGASGASSAKPAETAGGGHGSALQ